jgi:ribosomal protein L19E
MVGVQRGFSGSGPAGGNGSQSPPRADASRGSQRESLHDAFEAARAQHHGLSGQFEAAKARLEAIADWIETRRPQREGLRESAVARMQARLESQPLIEQAKGIVMAQQRCGPEEAFDLLRRASQRANVQVHVLAAQVVAQVAASPAEARALSISARRDRARSSGALNRSGEPRGRLRSGSR